MAQTHDIFLRAYAMQARVKKQRKRNASGADTEKWPEFALVFDTETRITADQSLTFGVYRLCKLVGDDYELTEEGIFYADDLSPAELRVLKQHVDASVPDVNGFPPIFPLYTCTVVQNSYEEYFGLPSSTRVLSSVDLIFRSISPG